MRRQARFRNHPWSPGEMEAAIAAFSGEVTKCPQGWADGIQPQYIKGRQTK